MPYATDGKARCGRLKLVRPWTTAEFLAYADEFIFEPDVVDQD